MKILSTITVYILTLSLPAECDTRTIFKWSTAGLNSKFFFSWINYQTSLPSHLPIAMYIVFLLENFQIFVCLDALSYIEK